MAARTRDTGVDARTLRLLATAADADERTVSRALRGERIRIAAVRERVERAIEIAGLKRRQPADDDDEESSR